MDNAIAYDAANFDRISDANHQELMNHPRANAKYRDAILGNVYGPDFKL